jgi:hypothetical protein
MKFFNHTFLIKFFNHTYYVYIISIYTLNLFFFENGKNFINKYKEYKKYIQGNEPNSTRTPLGTRKNSSLGKPRQQQTEPHTQKN